eukprot:3053531-Rhodomonas_salina.1
MLPPAKNAPASKKPEVAGHLECPVCLQMYDCDHRDGIPNCFPALTLFALAAFPGSELLLPEDLSAESLPTIFALQQLAEDLFEPLSALREERDCMKVLSDDEEAGSAPETKKAEQAPKVVSLEQCIMLLSKVEVKGKIPLHLTSESGDVETMKTLLTDGSAVLLLAVAAGNLSCSCVLVASGVNVDIADHKGSTQLLSAINLSDIKHMKLLLEQHADVHARRVSKASHTLNRERPVLISQPMHRMEINPKESVLKMVVNCGHHAIVKHPLEC